MNAPEYIFLISDLAGERRFASSVSKRLESLGALTHGDRRATESRNLSQFNVENKYGRAALNTIMTQIFGSSYDRLTDKESEEEKEQHKKLVALNKAVKGAGLEISTKDLSIAKFLNRILGFPVDLQNDLFKYFMETLDAEIEKAKQSKNFDMGIMGMCQQQQVHFCVLQCSFLSCEQFPIILFSLSLTHRSDLGNTDNAEEISSNRFMRKHVTGISPITLTKVALERGMSWEDALEK